MSVTPLRPRRPHTAGRRQIVHTLLPARMANDLRRYAESLNSSTAEAAGLVLADFVIKLRQERTRRGERAEVLDQLEASGCRFSGLVEHRHRTLARRLEAIDAETAS